MTKKDFKEKEILETVLDKENSQGVSAKDKNTALEKFEAEKRKHRKAMSELEFDLEDIDPKYRGMAETIGIESYRVIVAFCGGGNLYFPKYENIIEKKRKKYVYNVFLETGANYSKTAVYCGLSLSTVRRYVKECMKNLKNKNKLN